MEDLSRHYAACNEEFERLKQQLDEVLTRVSSAGNDDQRESLCKEASELQARLFLFTQKLMADARKSRLTEMEWISQRLVPIDIVWNRPSGSRRHRVLWPKDLKKWVDFPDRVRAHVKKLDDSTPARMAGDFEYLDTWKSDTHDTIRQRFAYVLAAFLKYDPFKGFEMELDSAIKVQEGANTELSTEPSTDLSETRAADRATKLATSGRKFPDISMYRSEKKYFLIVECKRPNHIRDGFECPLPDLVSSETQRLQDMLGQVTSYMVRRKVSHGILTSEDVTYFLKLEGQSMFVSDGIIWNSTEIQLLGAIHYFLNEAKDAPYVNFTNYSTIRRTQQAQGNEGRTMATRSMSRQQQVPRDVSAMSYLEESGLALDELNARDLHLAADDYACGSNGPVARGNVFGKDVIVKIACVDEIGAFQTLVHEIIVYERLRPLWGSYIPNCVHYGLTVDGSLLYLAVEYLEGLKLDQAVMSENVATSARAALRAIHCHGVLHGDLHAENILVLHDSVRIIDFDLSEESSDEWDQKKELQELEELLAAVTHDSICGLE